ncbi:hypothetical protein ACFLZS_00155 [Patescibacteria group bacterium]
MSKFFSVILVLLLLAAIGAGVYVWWTYSQKITDQEKEIEDLKKEIEELKETDIETISESGLKFTEVYQSNDFGYKVQYPESWSVSRPESKPENPEDTETVKFLGADEKDIVTVVVQLKDLEGMLKETFEIQKTTTVTIAQTEGEKLEVIENKNSKGKVYYLATKGEYLYSLSAATTSADLLEEMVETFSFSL